MLWQIIINIRHCENRSVPQSLAVRYFHIMAIQLLVMAESPWFRESGTIPWQQNIKTSMAFAENAFMEQAKDANIPAYLWGGEVELQERLVRTKSQLTQKSILGLIDSCK